MTISVTHTTPADDSFSAEGAAAWDAGHAVAGLGTMAEQNANNVAITGGTISGVSITGSISTATNLAGGSSGQIAYQSASGTTTFVTAGSSGQVLSANAGGIPTWITNTVGTVTSVDATAGTGISVSGGPITTSGSLTITNTAPDQVVAISAGTGISVSGTYPNFTVANTSPSSGGDVVGPASATDNAIVRFDATTGKLIQNSAVTIDDAGNIISPDSVQFSGTVPATQPIGTLWFDNSNETLNFQQNNITQQIGEEIYVYGKASNTITGQTLLQAIVKTGVVGASGVITFGVAGAGVTDGGVFVGIATENITANQFGRITNFGIVHGINTTGSTYGETWVDGQDIWYNPTTGGLTKTKPVAPNIKVQLGTVINAGPGGSGSFQVLLGTGSSLGGTDDNVQITTPVSGNVLTYNGTYWYNAPSVSGGAF